MNDSNNSSNSMGAIYNANSQANTSSGASNLESTSQLSNQPTTQPNISSNPEISPINNQGILPMSPQKSAPLSSGMEELNSGNMKSSKKPSVGKKIIKMLIIVLLLILVSLIGLLFLNKSKNKPAEPTDTEGEITWWGFEDPAIYASVIKNFEDSNPNTKINYVQKSKDKYREVLTNAFGRGAGPDLFVFHNSWLPMFKNQLDVMPSFVMSSDDFEKTFYPVAVSDLSRSEGIYGIPLEYDAITLYINQEVFSTAGKTPPAKWDELETLATQLTQKDNRGIIILSGVPLGGTENIDYWPEIVGFMIYQNHAVPSDPKSGRAIDAMRFYRQFSGLKVWSNILPTSTKAFANGDVAMFFGTAESASEILLQNPNLKFKTIKLPQLRTDSKENADITYATYFVQGVWNQSPHRGVAWNFLKYLSTSEALQEIHQKSEEVKIVGNPYPRQDMAYLLKNDPIVGSIIQLAPTAKSWYLQSLVDDGETGLNSKLITQYKNIINSDVNGDVINGAAPRITNILIEYGLKAKPGVFAN